jgi:hypothetical protein
LEAGSSHAHLPDDVDQFVVDWLADMNTRGLRDGELWDEFGNDFHGWTESTLTRTKREEYRTII